MQENLNNSVERLASLFGHAGKAKIAQICEVTAGIVTRWAKRGRINPHYNTRLKRGIYSHARENGLGDDWILRAIGCLESERCPTCGQTMER